MELDASCAQAQHEQTAGQTKNFDLDGIKGPIHFVGIGGIGMSAIARLLLANGRPVTGSDQSESPITDELKELGAKIFVGHQATNVKDAAALVVSTAINKTNPELVFAQEHNLPICHRSDLLSMLSRSHKLIAISGTHGKTTTTGMVGQVLLDCGVDPSIVVGGIFDRIGSNAHCGKGDYFVAEADESDRTHAQVTSYISVLTNIEADHLENYPGGIKQIRDVMTSFANNSEFGVVICADDPGCQSIMPSIEKRKITYGKIGRGSDYSYESLAGSGMRVFKGDRMLGTIELSVPGEHNKYNALATICVAMEIGLNFDEAALALAVFHGVDRRFQIIGDHNNITVVDDYAHHPTEVVATLQAAHQYIAGSGRGKQRIVAVFQPHQPGRLRDLWDEFCQAFGVADLLLVADVYVARGGDIENINSERFTKSVNHPNAHYLKGATGTLTEQIAKHLQPGDLVITIGAGDITKVGPQLVQHLKQGHCDGSSK